MTKSKILTLAYRFAGLSFEEIAPCCAHNFCAFGTEIPHLQGEKSFLRRTRRRKKQIELYLRRARRKLCEAFDNPSALQLIAAGRQFLCLGICLQKIDILPDGLRHPAGIAFQGVPWGRSVLVCNYFLHFPVIFH